MCELTLAIIKPHILKQPHILHNIRLKILNQSFKIVKSQQKLLQTKQVEQFYEEHNGKFFYGRLCSFMTSGPSDFYILAKRNAIADWRTLMGGTKVFRTQFSQPESIRGLYGLTDTRNAAHGSDSWESAEREINIFFPEFDIKNWIKQEKKYFKDNLLEFKENEFIHKPLSIINK